MPQKHLSAVETLRRSKHLSAQQSKYPNDSHVSSDVGTSAHSSPHKCSFPASADVTAACCTVPRVLNGKRRLSSSRRDDSSSGCERQRKYCGSAQQKLFPAYQPNSSQPNNSQPNTSHETVSETNDSVITQYLSFKVEHMDLQSDVPSAGKPPSPQWIFPGKYEATNGNTSSERRARDPDTVRSFTRYRHGPQEVHRTSGRRCRRTSGSRAAMSYRDPRRRDDKKLETFFSHMGMDARTLSATLSGSSAFSAFENVSSIDTSTLESRTSYAESDRVDEAVLDSFDVNERDTVVSSSVVERNARIIKWLCSIRKASSGDDIHFDEGFV